MFNKKINISGSDYNLVASALFKIKYAINFDSHIEQDLDRILELTVESSKYGSTVEEVTKKADARYYEIQNEILMKASQMAFTMIQCGNKEFNLDFTDFLNKIDDTEWVSEVVALAGTTFRNWEIAL